MDSVVKKLENVSLSDDEVLSLIDGEANLIMYSELINVDHIDQILHPYGACVILYLTEKGYGHWTCLFQVAPGKLEYFDSYGKEPDDGLDWDIPEYFRKQAHEDLPHLTCLLYNSPYIISYNHHPFQKKGANITTCGRHVAFRLICRELRLKDYIKLFKGYDADWLVTVLTGFINN